MEQKYRKLFQPFKIGNVEIKNRICMAPMCPEGWMDENNNLTDRSIAYFTERAKGGVGLIIMGCMYPNAGLETAKYMKSPFAAPYTFTLQTRKLAESCHRYGTKLFTQIQLGGGRISNPAALESTPVAPSSTPTLADKNVNCRELTTEEVYRLIDATVEGAILSYQAGADGININGVKGGYLGDQFATEVLNHRTDEFGGTLENRARLMTEIVKRIKEKTGPDFVVTTRVGTKSHMKGDGIGHLPGEEYTEYGRDMEESLALAQILEKAGYDAIVFGTGCYDSMYWLYPPIYMPDGCYLEEVAALKKSVSIPIICPGKLTDPAMAEKAIEDGIIDALGLGRSLLADSQWANKVRAGREEEIRPCIECNNGCISRCLDGKAVLCAVNPDVFCEAQAAEKYAKVETPKKIGIIGGGIAGMEAARVAAIRGHKVTIYEKENRLGGLVLSSEIPEFKKSDRKLRLWFERCLADLDVAVKYGCEINPETINTLDCDEFVVATGSTAKTLPVPGAGAANVHTAEDILLGKARVGRKIVVIGGGQVGCETALWLREKGCEVTVLEGLSTMIGGLVPKPNRSMLLELLQLNDVPMYTDAAVEEIIPDGVRVNLGGESRLFPCEDVIVAIGYRSNDELYRSFYANTDKPVWLVGDAQAPANIMMAIRDGSAIGALL